MKVLVTGSTGFLGRHAVRYWEDLGHDVTGIDIRSGIDCRHVYATNERYDIVMHFAAIVGGRATIDGNPLAVAETAALDISFFAYVQRTQPTHAIYPSSSAAYPVDLQTRDDPHPLAEHHINLELPGLPDAAYGWVKLTGEQWASYTDANVHIIRPMSGYGSDQDTSYPFGAFRDRAQRKADPFDIWGDGSQVRDWVHVDDIMGTIEAIIDADYQEPLNIGTGIPTSFSQLADSFAAAVGYTPRKQYHPERPTGVHTRYADVTNLHQLYTPRVSLAEGIRRAVTPG